MTSTTQQTTYSCPDCEKLVPAEQVIVSVDGKQAHLVDTGPGHEDIAVHDNITITNLGYSLIYDGHVEARAAATDGYAPGAGLVKRALSLASAAATGRVFWMDISEWQTPLTDAYRRPVVMIRTCLGSSYVDRNLTPNLTNIINRASRWWAWGAYHVWYPGAQDTQIALIKRCLAPALGHKKLMRKLFYVIDLESWAGQISGDHSAELTAFAVRIIKEVLGGDRSRLAVYGNQYDLASLYPNPPAWMDNTPSGAKIIVAGYSSLVPARPHWAWQYSDGESKWAVPSGYPRSTPGIGAGDHNVFVGSKAQFLTSLGLNPSKPKPPPVVVPPQPVEFPNLPWPFTTKKDVHDYFGPANPNHPHDWHDGRTHEQVRHQIRHIQARLWKLGYRDTTTVHRKQFVTGRYDEHTVAVVRKFQRQHHLNTDGTIHRKDWKVLMTARPNK